MSCSVNKEMMCADVSRWAKTEPFRLFTGQKVLRFFKADADFLLDEPVVSSNTCA
jgi:hypothetical protein